MFQELVAIVTIPWLDMARRWKGYRGVATYRASVEGRRSVVLELSIVYGKTAGGGGTLVTLK